MNAIFFFIVLISFLVASWRQLTEIVMAGTPTAMQTLGAGVIDSAKDSVTLVLGLIGVMAFFLGLMKVAENGGLLTIIAKLMRPILVRLFPDVPDGHPAMGAMIMNLSANVMGLGNAATPFGIRAMQELDRINPHKGTATDSMVLFLAINTSSITILPTGVIALRAAAGSTDPAGIVPTTLFATVCSTIVAIIAAKYLAKIWAKERVAIPEIGGEKTGKVSKIQPQSQRNPIIAEAAAIVDQGQTYPLWATFLALGTVFLLIPITIFFGSIISPWIIPSLVLSLLTFGYIRGVKIYESFVDGARDGFEIAVRIIPFLVAILVAIGMFRTSGAMELLIDPLGLITSYIGLPADALPMAILRPLSGSGAYGILASTIQDPAIGPDSYTGYLVSTLQGSTETTFYVLAVYFGAVQIRRIRHALAAGLLADVAGIAAAIVICSILYGN